MSWVWALMIPTLGWSTPAQATTMHNLFTPCASAQLKLTSPERGYLSQVTCSVRCKSKNCDGFSLVEGRCSLDDNTLPDSSAVTVMEGCYRSKQPLIFVLMCDNSTVR